MTDRIEEAEQKIDQAHAALSRVNGTKGVMITDPKLEPIIEALRLLAEEIRELRGGENYTSEITGGGIQVFDLEPPRT